MEWAPSLDEAARFVQNVCDASKAINPDVIVMCHGGPISSPDDAAYILQHTKGVSGFYGASSAERLPVEKGGIQKCLHCDLRAIPGRISHGNSQNR